jgi:HEAT repeat protein
MKLFKQCLLRPLLPLLAAVTLPVFAQAPDTNIEAVVRELQAPQTRSAAVRRLVDAALVNLTHQPEPYVSWIVASLTNGVAGERTCAAYDLGNCGLLASNPYPQLLLALKSGDPSLRIYSAGALPAIGAGNPEIVAALITALGDRDPEVRRAAAQSLGGFGSAASNAVPGLIKLLRQADAESVAEGPNRSAASAWGRVATALGDIGNHEAILGLEAALTNHDPDVRRTAAVALQTIKDRKP